MGMEYFEEQIFKNKDFTKIELVKGEYELCTFIDCNFSNLKLSDYKFIECEFIQSNLSNADVNKTSLQDVHFKSCKMMGLFFERLNPFALSLGFDDCNLSHASFYKLKLKNTVFRDCLLEDVDFIETDLSSVLFDRCDFRRATFGYTNLDSTDFSTSQNYSLDPEKCTIKKTKFSKDGLSGLLHKYDIIVN